MLPLRTPRLELRDFRSSDLEAVHRYASDPEVTRYMSWGPNDEAATRTFLEGALEAAAASPRTSWQLAITTRAGGELVGSCGAYLRREPHRDWEIGYVLARPHWRRGFGREAVSALVAFAFGEEVGAHRLYATVDVANAASAALLRGLGFRLEGHQHADAFVRGRWRDSLVFARLEPAHEAPGDPGEIRLEVTSEPAAHDVEALGRGLTEHGAPVTGGAGFRPLAVLARDGSGRLRGGCIGRINWNWLDVSLFWLDPSQRGRGLGARLLATLEGEARARGCTHAHLDTFSWQAEPFYRRRGYQVFATLDDYPPGQRRLYLRKRLDASAR
jgi:RimJ/RimL family protein N-acetyltransferase/GNAT superfamily N-acetyltransferase